MLKKAVYGTVFTLPLLTSMFILTFIVQPVRSDWVWTGNIYVRVDGSVDPPDAPIITFDNVTYTLTDDININGSIIIERDDIVVDGAGFTVQGNGSRSSTGIDLFRRNNVTIINMEIREFNLFGVDIARSSNISILMNNITSNPCGIYLDHSSHCYISGNIIVNNWGIDSWYSNNITIYRNNIRAPARGISTLSSESHIILGNNITTCSTGIHMFGSGFTDSEPNAIIGNYIADNGRGIREHSRRTNIFGNNITNNHEYGIYVASSYQDKFHYNNIANNTCGILLESHCTYSKFFHNIFADNTEHLLIYGSSHENSWDDGYPSGGNYWSDYYCFRDLYTGPYQNLPGADGICDALYHIDNDNEDRYPLTEPPVFSPHDLAVADVTFSKTVVGQGYNTTVAINVTIMNSGEFAEAFNFTFQKPSETQKQEITLEGGDFTTLTFTLNTTGWLKGNYVIKAVIDVVPEETYIVNNNYSNCIFVTTPGDVTSYVDGMPDGWVDMRDIEAICNKFGTTPADIMWNANMDINDDEIVNMRDVCIACDNFMKT